MQLFSNHRRIASAGAGVVSCVLAVGPWSTPAIANPAHTAAAAAATRDANKCGAQFKGAPLYACVARAAGSMATRIAGTGKAGSDIAQALRTAAATVQQAKKPSALASLSSVRSTIAGWASIFKAKHGGETTGMNAMSSAVSTMMRVVQSKG